MIRTTVTFSAIAMTLALNANAQAVRVTIAPAQVYVAPSVQYYRPVKFRGITLNVYSRGRAFAPRFYAWVGNPWRSSIRYRWNWYGAAWYSANRNYFIAEPTYTSAPVWLGDYVIANGLQQCPNCVGASYAPITAQLKQAVSNEIQRQISVESTGANSSIFDGQYHVLVATSSIPASTSAQQCMINGGDVIEFDGRSANESIAYVRIVSSRGQDCPAGQYASVWTTQLQEMANQMTQTVDQGMDTLRAQQDQVAAPADQTTPTPSQSVALGQSIADVESILGAPSQRVDLGSKKLYIYNNMKVTFIDGQVSDVS